MFKNLIRKIVLPMIGFLLLLVVIMSANMILSINQVADDVAQHNAYIASAGIQTYLEEFRQRASMVASIIANDHQFIQLVRDGGHQELLEFLDATKDDFGIDFYVVQDNEARVLVRTHDPERYGDIAVTSAWEAARDGYAMSNYRSSDTTPLAYSTRAIIRYEGEFIGLIIANLYMSEISFMQSISEIYNAELTFYFGNRAVASTWLELSEEAEVYADDEVVQAVQLRREAFGEQISINGVNHFAHYFPLYDSNYEVIGMIAAAFSGEFEEEMVSHILNNSIALGFVIMVAAVVILSIIIFNIVKPIKESGERQELMFDSTPLIIEYWDASGKIIDCNQTALKYYKVADKEEYIKVMDDFYSWNAFRVFLDTVHENGSGSTVIEDPQPDGSVIIFEIDAVCAIRDGKPVVVTYSQDVTEFRKLQNEQEDLMQRLETANNAKSKFLSNMSHEIRTPMSAIIGMTSIAMNTDDVEKKDDSIGKIAKASVHLLGIVNQILDISKIETEQFELDSYAFEFRKMVDEVISVLSVSIEEKQLDFEMFLDDAIPYAVVQDETRFAQVLTNLLGNAIKFTPQGGKVTLSATLYDDGSFLRIEVTDTGIGIPVEMQPRLFEDFMQVEADTSRRFSGTGLGLAISKRIVEMMGGKIWFDSETDVGSRFIFTIPILVGVESEELSQLSFFDITPQDFEPGCFSDYTILLAEDMEINREIVISLLESTGIQIECAVDGVEALQMFNDNPELYDLIFMDVQMPGMDGLTATRLIREIGTDKAKNIPIVALTANVFQEDIDVCLEAGMNDHLSKPLDLGKIIAMLKLYLMS